MNVNIFFDTNILIYAYCPDEKEKCAIAREYIEDGLRYGIGFISAQVLSEFVVNLTRKTVPAMPWTEACLEIDRFSGMGVIDIDGVLVRKAMELVIKNQLSYWDALIIAAAEKAGCRTLLSEDLTPGQKFGTLEVVNPFLKKVSNRPR